MTQGHPPNQSINRSVGNWPLTTGHWPLFLLLLTTYCLLPTSAALADTPSVSYIFPAGGQRGTSVAFHLGGHYLHEVCPFEMLGPGVTATPQVHRTPKTVWFEGPQIQMPASQRAESYPKDQAGAVSIAPDAPLGVRRYRVWTSQGVIPTGKFIIGDLPEIVEHEVDGNPIPVAVQLPLTINGRIFPREDVDIWKFTARAGHGYTCEVMAARLGSPLDSRLEVIGPDGRRIAENVDALGSDSFLQFTAPTDGDYQVRIHDINFGGLQHYVYRLTIDDGPWINHVYPLGGRKGDRITATVEGMNVPQNPLKVELPTADNEKYSHRFQVGARRTNPVEIELSDYPEHLEAEPNNDPSHVRALQIPAVFNGRIEQAGDVDYWRFRAAKDEEFVFDLRAARLGSLLDSVLTLRDVSGKVLAENDDLSASETDSRIQFKLPADGVYTLTVRSRTPRRAGRRFAYRLHVAPPENNIAPDFQLQLPADGLTLDRGAEVKFKIKAFRRGGFDGEIALKLADLPAGVSVSEAKIPAKKNEIELKLKAEKTAVVGAVHLSISGTGKIGEQEVTRTAVTAESPVVDHVLLAVSMPTPFKVIGIFQTRYAGGGQTYFRHLTIERGGFEGPLTIKLADRQIRHLQGVTGGEIVVPPGENEFDYPIYMAPGMQPARTCRVVVAATGIITDEQGKQHKVSSTSIEQANQIIVFVTTGDLTIDALTPTLIAPAGGSVPVQLKIGRRKTLAGPVRLQLVVPEHIHGVSAEDVVLPANKTTITMMLKFTDNPKGIGPFNMPLTIRATTKRDGQPYTAEGKIELLPDRKVTAK